MGSGFAQALRVQRRVVEALMTRDVLARFGRGNIGFLWVVVEPMILCTGVVVLWSMMKPGTEHGVQVAALVFTGYMPLTLWRHISNRGSNAFRNNVDLLYHRQLTIFDVLLSRAIMELGGTTLAALVVYTALQAIGIKMPVASLGYVLAGWFGLGFLAFGFMLILAALLEQFEIAEKFVGPFQYLNLPLSGCFFLVEWMPASKRDLILYNPQVHCFELVRRGLLPGVETHFDLGYLVACCIVINAVGLYMVGSARRKMHFN